MGQESSADASSPKRRQNARTVAQRPPRPERQPRPERPPRPERQPRPSRAPAEKAPPPPRRESHSSDDDMEALRLQELQQQAETAAALAMADAELAAIEDLNDDDAGMDVAATWQATSVPAGGDDLDIGDVSLHSSDFKDEELLQGLRDVEEELEAEFLERVQAKKDSIQAHKEQALYLLKQMNDKPGAMEELKKAKQLEEEVRRMQDEHDLPPARRIQELQEAIESTTAEIASKRQDALSALKRGEKLTAAENLKAAKELEKQLAAMKEDHRQAEAAWRSAEGH